MNKLINKKLFCSVYIFLFLFLTNIQAFNLLQPDNLTILQSQNDNSNADLFAKKITLNSERKTIYLLLNEVSEQSGYSFIYDSKIIENDKKVTVKKGEYSLKEAIISITGNNQLKIEILNNHILIKIDDEIKEVKNPIQKENNTLLKLLGTIYDKETLETIPFACISLSNTTIGTVSNQNGDFQLIIPDTMQNSSIKITHIGYENQNIETLFLINQHVNFFLKKQTITLPEVMVIASDPMQLLKEMLSKKDNNYSHEPVYLTCFYREGIERRKRNLDVTEAVLKIYKTDFQHDYNNDYVKLLKKRRASNILKNDTIFPRMKSGINSCLLLDIIKELPDFLDFDNNSKYSYTFNGITTIDNKLVNIVNFKQKPLFKEPLFTGDIYIENESKALIEIQFEINPLFAELATNNFIRKKTHNLKLTLQQAKYTISYKCAPNGIYYINHIRGDIVFNVKEKNSVFSTPLHFWIEMVTCKIDTGNVNNFNRSERLNQNIIFSETKHNYDKDFWESFNLILPEERLKETMINNLNDIIINVE